MVFANAPCTLIFSQAAGVMHVGVIVTWDFPVASALRAIQVDSAAVVIAQCAKIAPRDDMLPTLLRLSAWSAQWSAMMAC